MAPIVTSLKCHTCGAPSPVAGDQFNCAYCGTANIVTPMLQSFYRRALPQSTPGSRNLAAVTDLAHAIGRIRSYTSKQIKTITEDLESLRRDEDRTKRSLSDNRKSRDSADVLRQKAWSQFWPHFWLAIFAGGVVWAHFHPDPLSVDWDIKYQATQLDAAVAKLLFAKLCHRPPVAILFAALIGTAYSTGEYHPVHVTALVIAILILGFATLALVRANRASRQVAQQEQRIRGTEGKLSTQQDQHNAHVSQVVKKHAQMLGEIRSFLRAQKEYEAVQDSIAIGIQMDEALSSLNDLTFGNIIDALQKCSAIVNTFESRSSSVRGLVKTHS